MHALKCMLLKRTRWCKHAHHRVFLHIYSKASVDHLKSCIFILLVFTEPWCHWAAELVSKLQRMNRKSACYLQNVWEYQKLRLSLSLWDQTHSAPVSTALNEHVSARTTTLWLLLNEYPLVCVSGRVFFFTDARLLSVSICVWVFPWRVLCVRLPSIHQPYDNRSTLPIPSLTNHCHGQMMDISCKGRTFTAGLSKLKATSTFIERLSISCFVLLFWWIFQKGP